MSPVRRFCLPTFSLSLLAALLCIPASVPARAQTQTASSDAAKPATVSGPKKPIRKPYQVLTSDPVVLLGVRHTPPVEEAQILATSVQATDAAADTQRKAAEIGSIEKQIREKTTRIALLMRLFVDDERPFLNDPASRKVDEAALERRKYEQDELLYETAELAKLKTRLNQITAEK